MRLDELKKGFFGYKKESVYQMIASMETEFSEKLVQKDEQAAKASEEMQRKIQEMETEIKTLREDAESQHRSQKMISDALLEARSHAESMREDTLRREQAAQSMIREERDRQLGELETYLRRVRKIRENFLDVIREMDNKAQELEKEMEALREEAPRHNLSLFQKNEKAENE